MAVWRGDESPRFIPTCVGNMLIPNAVQAAMAVHPHVCGEHAPVIVLCHLPTGSSPRVWGTLLKLPLNNQVERFIPTCVGNIPERGCESGLQSVHPHVCGEHARDGQRQ